MKDSLGKPPDVVAVGGVLYRHDSRGKLTILLIKKRGGYWTLPKGKLMPGEDDSTALAREVAEETGFVGEVGAPVSTVTYKICKQGRMLRKHVAYYLVHITGGELQLSQAEQIIKASWFAPAAALRRLRRGRLRVILRHGCLLLGRQNSS